MREWQVGDPIGDGNDLGVPDIPYMGYLKDKSDDDSYEDDWEFEDDDSYDDDRIGYSPAEYIAKANQLKNNGDYVNAIKLYNLALDKRLVDEALKGKAECLESLGRKIDAANWYSELGYFKLWIGDRDMELAAKYYKKAVELNPNDEKSLKDLGYALKRLERYDEALKYYSRITNEDVSWHLAMCHMGMEEYDKAIPFLDIEISNHPYRDDHLDDKCQCLINLNRKSEAIQCYKDFIDFLMSRECYQKAIDRIDLLSEIIPDDPFLEERKSKSLKNMEILYKRLQNVLNAIASHHMYNPDGLDENDYMGFVKHITQVSGESIGDILRWYQLPRVDSVGFADKCEEMLFHYHWSRIIDMYDDGKLRGL